MSKLKFIFNTIEGDEVTTVRLALAGSRSDDVGVDLVVVDSDGDIETRVLGITAEGNLFRYAYGFLGDESDGDDEAIPLEDDVRYL